MPEGLPLPTLNDIAQKWGDLQQREMAALISQLNIRDKGKLFSSLRVRFKKVFGEIETIQFQFRLYGLYVAKGVGRDTPISAVGSTNRIPKDWITPVLEPGTEDLADQVSNIVADAMVKGINFNPNVQDG